MVAVVGPEQGLAATKMGAMDSKDRWQCSGV
jgi:hypothetical protein